MNYSKKLDDMNERRITKISQGLEAEKILCGFFSRDFEPEGGEKLCDKFAVFGKENGSLRENS